jgi:molybdate transport system substrate-binding protein
MPARLAALLLLACCAPRAPAAEVTVAAAANFAAPLQKIAAAFERDTGHKALLALGSTGKLQAQVRNGAPFGVLLAADAETPARLAQDGFAVDGSRFTYAVGRLVLWSAQAGRVDAQGEVLRRGDVPRLALADPKLAPYGAAALQVLDKLGVRERWQGKLVQGESIAQAYQFVASGNAPIGFVALSQVMAEGRIASGSAWVVPASLHAPLKQDAVLLNAGRGNPAALALLRYLRGDTARALIRGYGYETP